MPTRLPVLLAIATVVSLGSFGWLEYRDREALKQEYTLQVERLPQGQQGVEEIERDSRRHAPIFGVELPNERPWMQVTISLILIATALFVILSKKYGPKDKHWAYGIVGTIVGFWLRS